MPSGLVALLVLHLKSALDCCFSTGRRDRTSALRCLQHLFRTAASVKSDAPPAGRRVDAVTIRICKQRGTPFTTADFARMIERAGCRGPELGKKARRHMLRCHCLRQQGARNVGDSGIVRGFDQSRARQSTWQWPESVQGPLEGVRAATIF